jgi:hypothetical protein
MTTLDLIQAKLTQLDESHLQEIYAFIQKIPTQKPVAARPGLLTKLRQIQIEGPPDFAENLDFYLNQEHNVTDALS